MTPTLTADVDAGEASISEATRKPRNRKQSRNAEHHAELIAGVSNRLGLRLHEFCTLTGMSLPTLWRRIKAGDVRVVRIGEMPFIAHAELVRLGLLTPSKNEATSR